MGRRMPASTKSSKPLKANRPHPYTPYPTPASSALPMQPQQRTFDPHQDFHLPYPRPSRSSTSHLQQNQAPLPRSPNTYRAHSMSDIRETSGYYYEAEQRRRIQLDLERMRIEAYGLAAARSSSSSSRAHPQPIVRAPSTRGTYNSTLARSASTPRVVSNSYDGHARQNSPHERAMSMIRESSGTHL
ncbi:hypothetical protein BC939DRAFT_526782 [Gamsiella multidivaricata]|uniref:uncharacterized protein n=1 Tax=Gamsiella multidivaricata TaxID=101098 RepID=UPI00221F77A4|nr:uncharacterized protein BC939DRAFT_526782 [Gamsiella multidivaricata]KAI7828144.1 hypothetical protein BC939DRAFT_526782 [Gamsiella multidivaricata]